ncbi:MAG: polysaccharide pyruvyl transferase family protein [Dysgonamonadaceae bacterium]|jgi:hypothetical protein|nr:polysaccharide pyruvyl transferase family protein [Dysgonamonadaceae bacterium]
MNIKPARLAYTHSFNLGDNIQTIATEQFLGNNPISIERHELAQYNGGSVFLLMQGYFFADDIHCSFPPSEKITPVFVGFHIEDTPVTRTRYAQKDILDYLKKFEPIGCRDNSTVDFLVGNGIDAYLTRCLTLTFPKRDEKIKGNKVFFIDCEWLQPNLFTSKKFNQLYARAEFLTQIVDGKINCKLSDTEKQKMAVERLEKLRNEAKLVVTSRLHIASPCVAMGIPVVLIPKSDSSRYDFIRDIIPVYQANRFKLFYNKPRLKTFLQSFVNVFYTRIINWNPTPPDIENLRAEIKNNVQVQIQKAMEKC